MRVYVATSWKNPRYAEICKMIRDAGHEVLDWSSTDVAVPDFRKLDAKRTLGWGQPRQLARFTSGHDESASCATGATKH
jgi:hypothetical protein